VIAPVQRHQLSNGITLLVTPNPTNDIIAARLFVRSGSCWETPTNAGLLNLLASVLTKGTERLNAYQISDRVESVGAGLGTDASTDYMLLSLKSVSADFPELLKLAAEILQTPTFPEKEVQLERNLALQNIRSQKEQPMSIAFDLFRQALYKTHPYALSSLGTEPSVSQLDRDQLLAYHQQHFRPDNLIISIAGKIDPDQALTLCEQTLGTWARPDQALPQQQLPPVNSSPSWVQQHQASNQAILMLGYLAPSVHDPDHSAMKLLNTYLGNGMSSRLFVELREKQGLAYDVSAFYPTRLHRAPFGLYIGTAPHNLEVAYNGLKFEADRLAAAPLEAEELQVCKSKLLGQYALSKQTNAQLAQVYGSYETLGLGLDFDDVFQEQLKAVTIADLQRAAQANLGNPYVSVVGPQEAIDKLCAAQGQPVLSTVV
jgi:zinc protease